MSWFPRVYADLSFGGQIDQGNRLRVSQLFSLADLKQTHSKQPLLYSEEIVNGGTAVYDQSIGGTTMSVSTAGDYAIRQSKNFYNYQSGKPQFIECTASDFHPEFGITKRYGYYSSSTVSPYQSDLDGFFIEVDDLNEPTFYIYKDGTEVYSAAQSSWNVNKLDGNGSTGEQHPDDPGSKITVSGSDWSQFHVFIIDFLYLGGTSARFGFVFNGRIYWSHIFNHAFNNTIDSPFVINPNQPIRYEIFNDADGGSTGSFNQICAQVSSEGSLSEVGIPVPVYGKDTGFVLQTSGTSYAVVGYQLKSDYRDITINTEELEVLVTTNDNFMWEVCLNPTIDNTGAITTNSIDDAAIEELIADQVGNNTNTVTDANKGYVLSAGYGQGSSVITPRISTKLKVGSEIDGTMDQIWLVITPLSTNMTIYAGINLDQLL